MEVSFVKILFDPEGRIRGSIWMISRGSKSGRYIGFPWWKCQRSWFFRKCVLSGLWSPLVGIHRTSFIGDLDAWGLLLLLFWTSQRMCDCRCRQRWVRQCQSCPDRRLGVWGKWCIWRIHLCPQFLIMQSLGKCGVVGGLSRRESLRIGWLCGHALSQICRE